MPLGPLELLQAGDSSVAVATGVVAVIYALVRVRRSAISKQYQHLADEWTNEGAVDGSVPGPFIHMVIKLEHGDLVGQLHTSDDSNPLYINVLPAWPKARVSITNSFGKTPSQVAQAKIQLFGNNNRLRWKLKPGSELSVLPLETELWPVPMGARQTPTGPT
jgi:hypothetical protein